MDPFLALAIVQGIAKATARAGRERAVLQGISRERAEFERAEDARVARAGKLEAIGARASFASGVFVGGAGMDVQRAGSWATVAVTDDRFVLLDGDPESDPETELGRLPRAGATIDADGFEGRPPAAGAGSGWGPPSPDGLIRDYLAWAFGPSATLPPEAEDMARGKLDHSAGKRSALSAGRIVVGWDEGEARFLFASRDGALEVEPLWRRHALT